MFKRAFHILSFILLFLILSCNNKNKSQTKFTRSESPNTQLNVEYRNYCQQESKSGDHQRNAVVSAFYGDYAEAIRQAYLDRKGNASNFGGLVINSDFDTNEELCESLQNGLLKDIPEEMLNYLQQVCNPRNLTEIFEGARLVDAVTYIKNLSKDYHFTLINEAHYCSQHRKFTEDLLQPLWDHGYRYLALEAFAPDDTLINQRGYPTSQSGYYLADATFSNMIRSAIDLGYQIIPYETEVYDGSSDRELEQARNLVKRTWAKDKIGKVLVHAGYSHIEERGDEVFLPMGAHLKRLADQEIFTIDQESMTWLYPRDKNDQYHQYVVDQLRLSFPSVVLDEDHQLIRTLMGSLQTDLEVYHPPVTFFNNRPAWISESAIEIELPSDIRAHQDCLLQVFPTNERDGLPVDKFIIDDVNNLAVPKNGEYRISIHDCKGELVANYDLEVF